MNNNQKISNNSNNYLHSKENYYFHNNNKISLVDANQKNYYRHSQKQESYVKNKLFASFLEKSLLENSVVRESLEISFYDKSKRKNSEFTNNRSLQGTYLSNPHYYNNNKRYKPLFKKSLEEENYSKIICFIIFFLWFCTHFISTGILFLLPRYFEIISKNDKAETFKNIISTIYFFIPSPIIRGLISESTFFGRKSSIYFSLLFSGFFSFLSCFSIDYLYLFLGISSFFVSVCYGILLVYTAEYFNTKLRANALGIGNSLGRLGGLLAPFAFDFFDLNIKNGSLIAISFFSVVCFGLSLLLKETREMKIK